MKFHIRTKPGNPCKGTLSAGPALDHIPYPCALGHGGMTSGKREGDGATPRGSFRLLEVFYRADRIAKPDTTLPVRAIRPSDGWCDEVGHARYNRPVSQPFQGSHEELWREDHLYDIIVVLDCNISERRQGRGSAIFFHLAHADYRPTEGCVAVKLQHMRQILKACSPDGAIMVVE